VQLLQRFYDVTFGQIKIDGTALESLELDVFRKSLTVVTQEPKLFNMSVRDNITYGLEKPPSDVCDEQGSMY
jgi:ABC-type multidrug transport system fused ATPase/permease subunit